MSARLETASIDELLRDYADAIMAATREEDAAGPHAEVNPDCDRASELEAIVADVQSARRHIATALSYFGFQCAPPAGMSEAERTSRAVMQVAEALVDLSWRGVREERES